MRDRCPLLWGLLTQDTFSDGTVRALPTLMIDVVSGGYEVSIRDHASRQQAVLRIGTLGGLAVGLEAGLADPATLWRPFKSFRVRDPNKRARRQP